jgi:hypothetical protein
VSQESDINSVCVLYSLHMLQNLDGDILSVIENPVAVSHPFHPEKTGVGEARGAQSQSCHAWLRGIHSTNHGKAMPGWCTV